MRISEDNFTGFVRGDERAFEVIFRQYYKSLVMFSMAFGLPQHEAEDIVIETIHHVWKIKKEVKSSSALHSLFYTSVRNRTLNVMRNNKNRERILEEFNQDEIDESSEYLMREEMFRLLNKVIEDLPLQCKNVVLLLLDGLSVKEVADKLEISPNTAKTYKMRAIEIIRNKLKDNPLLFTLFIIRLN